MNYTPGFLPLVASFAQIAGWIFLETFGRLLGMDKETHGRLLRRAMAEKGIDRQALADAVGKGERTITNWRRGYSLPDDRDMVVLRRVLGPYDQGGEMDAVEAALERSPLIRWRRRDVLTTYERHLHEQQALGEVREG